MSKENESTYKFKVDISELKSSMQEAKREITVTNSAFKSATAGMDSWGKSTDGLQAKLNQLSSNLVSQNKVLDTLKQQYKLTVDEMGAGSKAAQDLQIKINNQEATIKNTEKSITNYNDKMSKLIAANKESDTALGQLNQTIKEQGDELNSLKKDYENAIIAKGKDSTEAQNLAKKISSLSSELQENKSKLNEAKSAANELGGQLKQAGNEAEQSEGGFTVLKGALADLVADGIQGVISSLGEIATSSDGAFSHFAAATGVGGKELDEFNAKMKELYNGNYGESLDDVADKMAKVKQQAQELNSDQVGELTKNLMTLESTFGMDFNETLRGVNGLMENMGLTSEQAFDLMAKGAQNGLNKTDELGDNIAEYSQLWGQAGFSAQDMFTILQNGLDSGAYNLDKVNDLVKEMGISLIDGRFDEQMNNFSKATQDTFKSFKEGGATQADVIKGIINDLAGAENQQEALTLASNTWSALGEDNAMAVITSLNNVNNTYKDVQGTMEEVDKTKWDNIGSDLESIKRTLLDDIVAPILENVLPALKDFFGYISDNGPAVIGVIAGLGAAFAVFKIAGLITSLVGVFTTLFTAIQAGTGIMGALNLVMGMNPFVLIAMAVAGLVAAFITLWNTSEEFRNFWLGLWDTVSSAATEAWNSITSWFSGVADWFNKNVIKPVGDFFTDLWSGITKGFDDLWSTISSTASTIADWVNSNVVEPIKNFFSPLVQWFTKLFTSIWNFIASVFTVIAQLAQGCWNAIVLIFGALASWFNTKVVQPVANFFTGLWNGIKSAAQTAWNFISGIWNVVASWFNNTIIKPVANFFTGMWSGLKDGASQAWEGIKGVFSSVASFFGDIFSKAWQKVKDVFSTGGKIFDGIKDGIVSAFKSIVNKIIKGINKVVKIPFDGINSALKTIKNFEILGQKPFKGLISTISVPSIPELAKGGILKKGQTGYLEGDGSEAVVPLEKNTGWLKKIAAELLDNLNTSGLSSKLAYAAGGVNGSSNYAVNNTKTQNVVFNQTINSPKAKSRLEIYRDTNALLFSAKGGLKNV